MKLSIVIPAYNEEARLGRMLAAYAAYFASKYGDDVELLVIVNGSRDHTADVAASFAKQYPCVRVLVEPAPIGKGGAVMLGMRTAVGDFMGFVDADGATPPEAFDDLLLHIEEAGAIIASRWISGAHVSPRQPLARRIASRLFNLMVKVFFDLRIHDTQCGAKLLRRDAALTILPRLGITRWAFDVDLLFQVRRAGYRVVEWPTTWCDVSGSRLNVIRASAEMFVALCRLRLLYSPFRWVVTVYDHSIGKIVHSQTPGVM